MKTTASECSIEPYTFDHSALYARLGLDTVTDLITSSTWVVTGNATLGANGIDTPQTSTFLTVTGVVGDLIVLKNTIEIDGAIYRDCKKLYITVK